MDYDKREMYDYFLEKIIDLEIKNRKLKQQNRDFEKMNLSVIGIK